MSIDDALRDLESRTVRRDGNRGRSFCGSCYYWSTCRGGCTWVSHVLESKRGDNPYCYYRATTLAKRGLAGKDRESRGGAGRAVRRRPFRGPARTRGRIARAPLIGARRQAAQARPAGVVPVLRRIHLCGGARVPALRRRERLQLAVDEKPAFDLQATIDEIEHHGRRISRSPAWRTERAPKWLSDQASLAGQLAFTFAILRSASSIRDCQPGPLALKYEMTSGLSLIDTGILVGALWGPRLCKRRASSPGFKSFNSCRWEISWLLQNLPPSIPDCHHRIRVL